jgi:DNA-binding response OmpR family regulator
MQHTRSNLTSSTTEKFAENRPIILLVGDFGAFCSLVWCQLTALDYKVLVGSSESAGRDLLIERPTAPVDLLFLDLNLPIARSREIAESFRIQNPDTKVLLMSTELNTEEPDENIGYLRKPFLMETLGEHLRKFLNAEPAAEGKVSLTA